MNNRQRPLDDGDWWALRFLLHALGGVFRGRVLLLAFVGLLASEIGAELLIRLGPESLSALSLPRRVGEFSLNPFVLARSGYEGQIDFWWSFVGAFMDPTFLGVLIGMWRIAAWSLFGAAVARIAALHMTLHDLPSARTVLYRSCAAWASLTGGVFAVLALVGVCVGAIWLAGTMTQVNFLAIITGPIALFFAGLATVGALGLAFGWPMMIASTAVERPDPFDAISCGFAYVYQRPLRLLCYVTQAIIVAAAAGMLVQVVVRVLLALATNYWSTSVGDIRVVAFWLAMTGRLPVVFHAAFFWFAAVAVYLLMRREIDEKQADEVQLDEEPQQGQ